MGAAEGRCGGQPGRQGIRQQLHVAGFPQQCQQLFVDQRRHLKGPQQLASGRAPHTNIDHQPVRTRLTNAPALTTKVATHQCVHRFLSGRQIHDRVAAAKLLQTNTRGSGNHIGLAHNAVRRPLWIPAANMADQAILNFPADNDGEGIKVTPGTTASLRCELQNPNHRFLRRSGKCLRAVTKQVMEHGRQPVEKRADVQRSEIHQRQVTMIAAKEIPLRCLAMMPAFDMPVPRRRLRHLLTDKVIEFVHRDHCVSVGIRCTAETCQQPVCEQPVLQVRGFEARLSFVAAGEHVDAAVGALSDRWLQCLFKNKFNGFG
jgi:hypothetical protein